LVAKPFFGGDAAPMGPHVVIVRLGPQALGPRPPGLIILRGTVLDSHHLFLGVRGPEGSSSCLGGESLVLGCSDWEKDLPLLDSVGYVC
jgi:hypothetical protein